MPSPGTILTVCTANICRQPDGGRAAATRARGAAGAASLAARAVRRGRRPKRESVSANSVTALKKVGLVVAGYRSRALTQEMLNEALLVLCMTESHRAMIRVQADPVPKNLYLFREFMPQRGDKEIGDPFGGPLRVYEAVRDEMVEAIPSLLEFIKTQTGAQPPR
jgi:protein-tyrosine phosphatase